MSWRLSALLLAIALAVVALVPASSSASRNAETGTTDVRITAVGDRAVRLATLPCQPSIQATSSGFVIGDGLIVTVAHAIYGSRDFAVRDAAGQWFRPTVRYIDLERDLAVLELPEPTASMIEVRRAQKGDRVRMVAGAASGTVEGEVIRRVRLTTEVIGDRSRTSSRSGYELSLAITGGDSGAAVLDDQDRLVGLVFARSTNRNASWATAVTEIADILERRGGPTWDCERDADVELVLPPS